MAPNKSQESTPLLKSRKLTTWIAIFKAADDDKKSIKESDLPGILNGFNYTREFYYRNSGCKLDLEIRTVIFDQRPPKDLQQALSLAQEKLGDEKPDLFFGYGPGYSANLGGFFLFDGKTGGAHAGYYPWTYDCGPADVPVSSLDANSDSAWTFAHEIQHAIDIVSLRNSSVNLLHAHPYVDRDEKGFKGKYLGGMHWGWIALTLREFGDSNWLKVPNPNRPVTGSKDQDNDGIPDDDPRMPIDEKRFGSDPTKSDTDGDGLSDLDELKATIYTPSNPNEVDTDKDGIPDGSDAQPCVAIKNSIPFANDFTKLVDSTIVKPFRRTDSGGHATCQIGWNDNGLLFNFVSPYECDVRLTIDGSYDNGFWEGGDSYRFHIDRQTVKCIDFRNDQPAGASVASRNFKKKVFVKSVFLPANLGQGVSQEINYGGERRSSDVTSRLKLTKGSKIGISVQYRCLDRKYIEMTPQCYMIPITLE